ncbi:MAG: dockerin type I repeat-containing protein, partial [Clostridia bacterium]|nr:dockerin type I repeat-containing protein [Clostridia bacterium]
GDGFYSTSFDKAYPAGTYTLRYTTGGSNGGWFVLASAPENGSVVSVSGGNTNENTLSNPYIGLITAEAPSALLGDVDGDGELSNKDVVLLFRAVSNGIREGEVYLAENADVNGDGSVDNLDVVDLFKMVTKGA